jgi:hypothetical protein
MTFNIKAANGAGTRLRKEQRRLGAEIKKLNRINGAELLESLQLLNRDALPKPEDLPTRQQRRAAQRKLDKASKQ